MTAYFCIFFVNSDDVVHWKYSHLSSFPYDTQNSDCSFLLSYFCFSLTETALNPDVWLWGMGKLQNRGELPMSHPPSLCLAQPHPHTWQVNALDGITVITRDTVIEEKPHVTQLGLPLSDETGGRNEEEGERDWGRVGKREKGRGLILLFSKFMLGRPHFQVNCNTFLLSLSLKDLPWAHGFFLTTFLHQFLLLKYFTFAQGWNKPCE